MQRSRGDPAPRYGLSRERQPPASVARLEPRPPEETGRAIKQQDDPIMTAKQFLAAIKRLGPSTPGYVGRMFRAKRRPGFATGLSAARSGGERGQ